MAGDVEASFTTHAVFDFDLGVLMGTHKTGYESDQGSHGDAILMFRRCLRPEGGTEFIKKPWLGAPGWLSH